MKSRPHKLPRFRTTDTDQFLWRFTEAVDPVLDFRLLPESAGCQRKMSEIYKAGGRLPRLKLRGTFTELKSVLRKRNQQGFGIFYSVNEMDGNGVKSENCRSIRALPLDLDGAPLPDIWLRDLRPEIIVETSAGRYQALFLTIVEKKSQFAQAEHMCRRLAATYGGDPSVCDRARVLRLPGFVHQKPGKPPFTSRILRIDYSKDIWTGRYDLRAFDKALRKLPSASARRQNTTGLIGTRQAALLFKHFPVEALSGNAAWQTFAMSLHSACNGDDEIAEMFFDFCMADPAYGQDDDQRNRLRWASFAADRPGGLTIATLRKFCRDQDVPGDVIFQIFNDAVRDFDNE